MGLKKMLQHFHSACRNALAPFGADLYPRFKTWCDEYFYLKHRQEQRGIGGIFFDDFAELGQARSFAMLQSVGDAFFRGLPAHCRKTPGPAVHTSAGGFSALPPGAATSNLIWCGTGVRTLACNRAAAPNRFYLSHALARQLGLPAPRPMNGPENQLLTKYLVPGLD